MRSLLVVSYTMTDRSGILDMASEALFLSSVSPEGISAEGVIQS